MNCAVVALIVETHGISISGNDSREKKAPLWRAVDQGWYKRASISWYRADGNTEQRKRFFRKLPKDCSMPCVIITDKPRSWAAVGNLPGWNIVKAMLAQQPSGKLASTNALSEKRNAYIQTARQAQRFLCLWSLPTFPTAKTSSECKGVSWFFTG